MDNESKQVGEIVAKQKRPGKSDQMSVQTKPGDNAKYLRHSLRIAKLGKVDINDNEAVTDRVFEYFSICADEDMKPSVAGLALALGKDRRRLWEIREGKLGKNPAVAETLKMAMDILDCQMVDYMQNGKINPVSGIFLMKNNFGYADKQEVVLTPKNPLGEDTTDVKALEDKYRESVPVDTEGIDQDE